MEREKKLIGNLLKSLRVIILLIEVNKPNAEKMLKLVSQANHMLLFRMPKFFKGLIRPG